MAEIPLCYPKIPHLSKLKAKKQAPVDGRAMAFRKYDGTNIHITIRKGAVHSFGTRRNRFPFTEDGIAEFHAHTRGTLGHVPALIEEISSKLTIEPGAHVTLFAEYHHPESFGGIHPPCADPEGFRLTLFDIDVSRNDNNHAFSLLQPLAFLAAAEKLGWEDVAEVLWEGSLRSKGYTAFLQSVTENTSKGFEGAVVKPALGQRFKIKSDHWTATYNAWMSP